MTIKEMEELAEMPRANIRFYEAEGLLSPARNVNGYRDYSQEDLLVLRKIKLLRSLHMSLEDIKALHTGKQELSVVLEQQTTRRICIRHRRSVKLCTGMECIMKIWMRKSTCLILRK